MLIARFWWGGDIDKRKIHWKNWESLCVSKLDGGLGFEAFDLALLASHTIETNFIPKNRL